MTAEPLNVAVVGCGIFGEIHAATYAEFDRSNLIAVCDLDADRAGRLAEKFGCRPCTSVEDVAADPDIQAVSVATPDGRPIKRTATLEKTEGQPNASVFTSSFQAYATGEYAIQATAKLADKAVGTDHTTVRVRQPSVEFLRTDPDRELLREMARQSGGKYLRAEDLGNLSEVIHLAPREIMVQPNAETDADPLWNRW